MTAIRVVVLDGVDWKYVRERWADAAAPLWDLVGGAPGGGDVLPHPAEEWTGCAALLRACEAPITPAAVAALCCGRDAGLGWFSEDLFTTSQELIRTRPWFPELWRAGLSLSLCNVPLTYPAFPMREARSWMTSGFPLDRAALDPSRNLPWFRPATLDVSGYPIGTLVADTGPGGSKDVAGLREAERSIVEWYLERAPRCDVEMIWLRSTDSAGHHRWGTVEYDTTVRHAAELAHKLCTAPGVENAVVISDHGFDATDSPRCEAYHQTTHGPAARRHGLCGSHSEEGILFARGSQIARRGLLPEQRLVDVAGGMFDLLQLPPAPGMHTGAPLWARPFSAAEEQAAHEQLAQLGYEL